MFLLLTPYTLYLTSYSKAPCVLLFSIFSNKFERLKSNLTPSGGQKIDHNENGAAANFLEKKC